MRARLIEKYPRYIDFKERSDGVALPTIADHVRSTAAALLGDAEAAKFVLAFEARYSFRRVAVQSDEVDAPMIWRNAFTDVFNTKAAPILEHRAVYERTRLGALEDNGRDELRTLYAAPNGVPSQAYSTGQEKLTVTGEYGDGFERMGKFLETPSALDATLKTLDVLFLGVM